MIRKGENEINDSEWVIVVDAKNKIILKVARTRTCKRQFEWFFHCRDFLAIKNKSLWFDIEVAFDCSVRAFVCLWQQPGPWGHFEIDLRVRTHLIERMMPIFSQNCWVCVCACVCVECLWICAHSDLW